MTESYVVAEDLGKSFGSRHVLHNVSLTVDPGEVIGVLGQNGAGKTTLLELILGYTLPTDGRVELFGHESCKLPGAAKARIGYVPQQDELIGYLRGRDQIALIRSFYRNWDDATIDGLARSWRLDLDERINAMSTGQRQKLSILLALGHRPDLLLLDEPVASLDPVARRHFLEQIVDVASDQNRSVVFSSHIVSDIERLASTIWIIKDGRLYWRGDFDTLKESIVRVHIRSASTLPEELTVPNAISIDRADRYVCAVVTEWSKEIGEELRSRHGGNVELERLSLEDIFVELHQ